MPVPPWIAGPRLLVRAGEAAPRLHRHQLFGDQLLHPFGVDAARQVNGAGGTAAAGVCGKGTF
jgi:hypothetical protein